MCKKPGARISGLIAPLLVQLLIGLAVFLVAHSVGADGSLGSFELGGDVTDDSGVGEPIDWETPPPNLTSIHDATGAGDIVFAPGSNELDPASWVCVEKPAPAKDDLVGGAVSIRAVGTDRFLYANFQRLGSQGDAHIGYEFNRATESHPACPDLPLRSAGDVLLTIDTDQAGRIVGVRAFEWRGDSVSGDFVELPLGSQTVSWDAAVNSPNAVSNAQPGEFGEVALNLSQSPLDSLCPRSVQVKTRTSAAPGAELVDRTASRAVDFGARPDRAHAHQGAFGARVRDGSSLDETFVPVASSQSGVGADSASDQLLAVATPAATGAVLRADRLRTSSQSTITNEPAEVVHTSTSESADVDILEGVVTADLIRAVATTGASGSSTSSSSLGSTFENLAVMGVRREEVAPNTKIDLPAELFGRGSYVLLREEVESTSRPEDGRSASRSYAADLEVNMIRVSITDRFPSVSGDQPLEVVVGNAVAHADFPQIEPCAVPPEKSVGGHAFVASEQSSPDVLPVRAGFVRVPSTGGADAQHLANVTLPPEASLASTGTSDASSVGAVETISSVSSSAQADHVCLLEIGGVCSIRATSLQARASSRATGAAASSSDAGTQLQGVVVQGRSFSNGIPANTVVPVDGVGFAVLKEQLCDDPGAVPPVCSGRKSSGLTVRALRLVITAPDTPFGPAGSELIVSEAHSDATFQ